MAKKPDCLDDCWTAKDYDYYLAQQEGWRGRRNGKGSHIVQKGPEGSVTYYHNGKEKYPVGTKKSIDKQARLAFPSLLSVLLLLIPAGIGLIALAFIFNT